MNLLESHYFLFFWPTSIRHSLTIF